jgi:hypothetical protein
MVHPLIENEDDEDVNDRSVLSMGEDLLLDTNLQITSVTKFCVSVWSQYDDYRIFRRFLHLFPNIVDLELDIEHKNLFNVLKHAYEDDSIKTVLARIKQLSISFCNGIGTLANADIQYLFPNAKRLVKRYDSLGWVQF